MDVQPTNQQQLCDAIMFKYLSQKYLKTKNGWLKLRGR